MLNRKILCLILNSHSKSPSEILYLENGCLPLKDVITVRRLLYLHIILERHDNDIIKNIYLVQKNQPCLGDWVKLIEADKNYLSISLDDSEIARMSSEDFANLVKSKVRQNSFHELSQVQKEHDKVHEIHYDSLSEPQKYLQHELSNNRLNQLLFNLRCQTVRNVKNYFSKQFKNNLGCYFNCLAEIESQQNILCKRLKQEISTKQKDQLSKVSYKYLFGNVNEQLEVGKVFQMLFKI